MLTRLMVYFQLGLMSLLKVIFYRLQVKLGYFKNKSSSVRVQPATAAPFFVPPYGSNGGHEGSSFSHHSAEQIVTASYRYFFVHEMLMASPPCWFINPFTNHDWSNTVKQHWSCVTYFDKPGEDIKVVWELSRAYWAPDLALAYKRTGDDQYLKILNANIADWIEKNPVGMGVNWLCAQEAGIRLINILLAYRVMGKGATKGVRAFVAAHVERILHTLHYAQAQANNHATTEAAAIYLAGEAFGNKVWLKKGRKLLEALARKLILEDGTFSQYSVTYHRMVLDTFSYVVDSNKHYGSKPFSEKFMVAYGRLFEWMRAMVDPVSYDAVNLGSNDGTLLFKLDDCDYRDFRPSLQLACVLLNHQRLFVGGAWDSVLDALGLDYAQYPMMIRPPTKSSFSKGGFVRFSSSQHWALLSFPRYKFRPCQCDALHLDVWSKGVNIFCDSGTYSYNPEKNEQSEFASVSAHNTVQFDDHDQMPRLSRFLYGAWTRVKDMTHTQDSWAGQYTDTWGAMHSRKVEQREDGYFIVDTLKGFVKKAVLRWHTPILDWQYRDGAWVGPGVSLTIDVNGTACKPTIRPADASLYYQEKHEIRVFELEVGPETDTICTTITLS
jgi:hypothetical protein